jgi:DinB family
MNLQRACALILTQLSDLVSQLSEQDFVRPAQNLSGSTIGQHLRHTLEFFICFEQGCAVGLINYDKRAHDKLIETDKFIALVAIQRINDFVQTQTQEIPLKLEVSYDLSKDDFLTVDTNYTRELVYNIEHAVHHMAIMKIGVHEIAPAIILPSDFGIAASTVRHKESQVAAS